MNRYEQYIDAISASKDIPKEAAEAAQDAISFVAALHNLYVDNGVLNSDAPVDLSILEGITDALHGELAAASIFLAQDDFSGVVDILKAVTKSMHDPDEDVPLVVKKGFERLANRVDKTRKLQLNFSLK